MYKAICYYNSHDSAVSGQTKKALRNLKILKAFYLRQSFGSVRSEVLGCFLLEDNEKEHGACKQDGNEQKVIPFNTCLSHLVCL